MLKRDTFALTALLAAVTALAPLSTDLYLPTLPEIGRAFGVAPTQVQLTFSAYLIGFAIGQISYGPISDWYGRRSGLLVALAFYCLGSLISLFAPSIEVLIGGRVIQAFGCAGAIVLARAVVRDFYSGARVGRELSMMGIVMAFGPVTAPLIGGGLQALFGWRASFAALAVFGLGLMVTVLRKMPESLGERPATRLSFGAMLVGYREVLRIREFNLYLCIGTSAYTGIIAWLSAAPFVLQNVYGQSPLIFSISFSATSVGFLLGTMMATRMVVTHGIARTLGMGLFVMLAGTTAMCISVAIGSAAPWPFLAGVTIYLIGFGLLYPQSTAGGLSAVPGRAGTASSLLGFVPQFSAALLGAGVVAATGETAWPVSIAVLAMTVMVLPLWLLLVRSQRV